MKIERKYMAHYLNATFAAAVSYTHLDVYKRQLTNNAVENIEEALGMTDATSSAMKHAIAEWYAAWYGRVPTKTEDPCQRLPYAIVNKLCKACLLYTSYAFKIQECTYQINRRRFIV